MYSFVVARVVHWVVCFTCEGRAGYVQTREACIGLTQDLSGDFLISFDFRMRYSSNVKCFFVTVQKEQT